MKIMKNFAARTATLIPDTDNAHDDSSVAVKVQATLGVTLTPCELAPPPPVASLPQGVVSPAQRNFNVRYLLSFAKKWCKRAKVPRVMSVMAIYR